ncbi:hypothetical protein CIHG_02122 [Coccidioides immitis H538.4]|uniref:Uncharacterized protein n=3 Tax=Coccidioides immitis TaxID=5501 RepID=A0A0J8RCY4_COCIT|nr:hypothetical protein CIRG_00297 [Coccidioides immitis RMSCC 2394]KMU81758.1 hypothetical protein CISG_02776 [Coccidioides immitis RMSCC 3703]KMU84336.1 hypothetical protein CIHG_02122 [Coccidioides immitis H538.4]
MLCLPVQLLPTGPRVAIKPGRGHAKDELRGERPAEARVIASAPSRAAEWKRSRFSLPVDVLYDIDVFPCEGKNDIVEDQTGGNRRGIEAADATAISKRLRRRRSWWARGAFVACRALLRLKNLDPDEGHCSG